MKKKRWIEHTKTVALALLVSFSLILSGFLWYNAPVYNNEKLVSYAPLYIFNDERYNKNKMMYQFVSPYQLIIHQNNQINAILPEEQPYKEFITLAHKTNFIQTTLIHPTPADWNRLLSSGVEFQYPHDMSSDQLDAFFGGSLTQQPIISSWKNISRIWFFHDPQTKQFYIWFISDADQEVAQSQISWDEQTWNTWMSNSVGEGPMLTAVSTTGKLPWDPTNAGQPFARTLYLPAAPITMKSFLYATDRIEENTMTQWLFKDPSVSPIISDNNESLYMFGGQLLSYNYQNNSMVYNDTESQPQPQSAQQELNSINNFVQRHRGWSGNYLLDEIASVEEFNQYRFRLFMQGYPVYWGQNEDTDISPDLIRLQTGSNGVNKYIRSMIYLTEQQPIPSHDTQLPGKDQIFASLAEEKIDLNKVQRIFLGFQAYDRSSESQVLLKPAWFVMVEGQPSPLAITSP